MRERGLFLFVVVQDTFVKTKQNEKQKFEDYDRYSYKLEYSTTLKQLKFKATHKNIEAK